MSMIYESGLVVPLPENKFWTEEKVREMVAMWKDGNSASAIAQAIGARTRNAVIGKLHRLGHSRGDQTKASSVRVRVPRVPRNHQGGKMRAQSLERQSETWRGPEIIDLPADSPDNPVTIAQLEKYHCRWPCSGEGAETLFCGGDTFLELSYCKRHCRLAYQDRRR